MPLRTYTGVIFGVGVGWSWCWLELVLLLLGCSVEARSIGVQSSSAKFRVKLEAAGNECCCSRCQKCEVWTFSRIPEVLFHH